MSRRLLLARWCIVAAISATAAFAASRASAGLIVEYNFNDNNAVVDVVAPSVSSTNYLAGTGLIGPNYQAEATARGFNNVGSAAAALTNNAYWQFTVTADAGYHLDLASLVLDEKRGLYGPEDFQIEVNGTLVNPALISMTSYVNHTVDLSAFTNLTSATIRLLAWDASNNGNKAQWFNDNVKLNGDVVQDQVAFHNPEPGSLAIWGVGVVAATFFALRRRRRTTAR